MVCWGCGYRVAALFCVTVVEREGRGERKGLGVDGRVGTWVERQCGRHMELSTQIFVCLGGAKGPARRHRRRGRGVFHKSNYTQQSRSHKRAPSPPHCSTARSAEIEDEHEEYRGRRIQQP